MVKQVIVDYFRFLSEIITTLLALCTVMCFICAMLFWTLRTLIRVRGRRATTTGTTEGQKTVAFFHPYCNAGGGGERVLWCAIRALQNKYKNIDVVVFTGDVEVTPDEILNGVRRRFNVHFERDIRFVYLTCRKWVEATTYPHFTLLGQSIGSMLLGFEALIECVPDIYIDSMGYAFTLPIFKYLGGCRVGCYVHYPTVSTDMLRMVSDRTTAHNNASYVGRNRFLTAAKVLYYQMFAFVYGVAGCCSEGIMVNSSWTRQHILQLWKRPAITFLVYPPCDVSEFSEIPISIEETSTASVREVSIVSVSQFRPEKDHKLQILSVGRLLDSLDSDSLRSRIRLRLIGSCRNEEDDKRILELKQLAKELNIEDKVEFLINVSFDELKSHLRNATIGLHTMWNEHFGIGVVECMAAGLVMLAHDSGGPKMDIVVDYNGRPTGFLASNVDGFAAAMENILKLSEDEKYAIRTNARKSTNRFSDNVFENNFVNLFQTLFLS